jgi:hypothetical protein
MHPAGVRRRYRPPVYANRLPGHASMAAKSAVGIFQLIVMKRTSAQKRTKAAAKI